MILSKRLAPSPIASAILAVSWLAAPVAAVPAAGAAGDAYTLETDLSALQERFNADRGKVRAVFLASPTCGICLRGVAELQNAMLAQVHAEDLVVYVVWSSQLGAQERHVQPAMRLIPDPRAVHYWDPNQLVGTAYQPVFDLSVPLWDYWLLYDRDAEWTADGPPPASWWEYQGRPSGRPEELQLDADRFAGKARELIDAS